MSRFVFRLPCSLCGRSEGSREVWWWQGEGQPLHGEAYYLQRRQELEVHACHVPHARLHLL